MQREGLSQALIPSDPWINLKEKALATNAFPGIHPERIRLGVLRFQVPLLSTITSGIFRYSYDQSYTSGFLNVEGLSFWLALAKKGNGKIIAGIGLDGSCDCMYQIGIRSMSAPSGIKTEQGDAAATTPRVFVKEGMYLSKVFQKHPFTKENVYGIPDATGLPLNEMLVIEAAFAFVPTSFHLLSVGISHLLAKPEITAKFANNPEKVIYGSRQWKLPSLNTLKTKEHFDVETKTYSILLDDLKYPHGFDGFKIDSLNFSLKLSIKEDYQMGVCFGLDLSSECLYYIGIGLPGPEEKNNVRFEDDPAFIDPIKHFANIVDLACFSKEQGWGSSNFDPNKRIPLDKSLMMEAAFAFIPKEELKTVPVRSRTTVFSTDAILSRIRNASEITERKLSPLEETFKKECSPLVQEYLREFIGKKRHSDILKDLEKEQKFSDAEDKLLEDFVDQITGKFIDRPVFLHEECYDLETVIQFNGISPVRVKFKPSEIESNSKSVQMFEETIKKIINDRKLARSLVQVDGPAVAPTTSAPAVAPAQTGPAVSPAAAGPAVPPATFGIFYGHRSARSQTSTSSTEASSRSSTYRD